MQEKVNFEIGMEKSEISEKNKDFITDIAKLRPDEQTDYDLDFRSDRSELILEKV
jgi:hypothetical protein